MVEPRCEGCRFWQGVGYPEVAGQCRRHAPGAYHTQSKEPLPGSAVFAVKPVEVPFPPMPAEGWCGEFEAKGAGNG